MCVHTYNFSPPFHFLFVIIVLVFLFYLLIGEIERKKLIYSESTKLLFSSGLRSGKVKFKSLLNQEAPQVTLDQSVSLFLTNLTGLL